jgi:hypothetical protein
MTEHHRQHAARIARTTIERYRRDNPQPTDVVRDRVLVVLAPQFGMPSVAIGAAREVRREFARLAHWASDPSRRAELGAGSAPPYVATFHVDSPQWWIPEQEWPPRPIAPTPAPASDPIFAAPLAAAPHPAAVTGSWYMFPASSYPNGIPGR